jgi:hypothetical protein
VNLCGATRDKQPPSPRTAARAAPVARARVIDQLAGLATRVPDETARIDLAGFTATLQAVN